MTSPARRASSPAFLLLLFVAGTAGASSLFEVAGATTSPNSLNARVMARDGSATFYNPALLPRARRGTEIGFSFLSMNGDIALDPRPRGVDVSGAIYDAAPPDTAGTPILPLPTADLPVERGDTALRQTTAYVTLGVVEPIASEALVFGFYGTLPLNTFHRQDPFFPDEREQYFSNSLQFELLGDRTQLAAFAVALGSHPLPWLSVGVGADVTIGTRAVTTGYVPDGSDQRTVLLSPDVDTHSVVAPYFGLAADPSDAVTMTFTAHAPVDNAFDGENRLRFFNYNYPDDRGYVLQTFQARQGYTPLRVSVGGAYRRRNARKEATFEIAGHALLSRWSQYVDRAGETPLDAWNDTISIGAGAWGKLGRHQISGDLFFAPSPVPDQTGRTNYVDNARVMASAGYGTIVTLLGVRLGVGAYLHGQVFIPRDTVKSPDARHPIKDEFADGSVDAITGERIAAADGLQTNNPGFPGFRSTGFVAGAGLSFHLPDITEIGGSGETEPAPPTNGSTP